MDDQVDLLETAAWYIDAWEGNGCVILIFS